MGKIPSGLYIMTSSHEGKAGGVLVSWVQQAGFDPPTVSVAVGRERTLAETVRQSGGFALSILGESDGALMKPFARGGMGESVFQGVRVVNSAGGMPVLADALGYLDCRVLRVCEFGGDHDLFVAEVVGGDVLKAGEAFVHRRGNGFHY